MSSINFGKLPTTSWTLLNLEEDIWITLTKNEIFDSIIVAIGLTVALALACDIALLLLSGTRKDVSYYSICRVIWAMNFKFTKRFRNQFYRHAVTKGGIPETYKGINWRKYSGLAVALLFFALELAVIFLSMPIRRNVYGELSQRGGWQLNKKRLVYGALNSGFCSMQNLASGYMVSNSALIAVCRELRVSSSKGLVTGSPLLSVSLAYLHAYDVNIVLADKNFEYGVKFSTSITIDGRQHLVELKQNSKEILDIVFLMMKQKGIFVGDLDRLRCWKYMTTDMCEVSVNTSHPDLIEYDENIEKYLDTFQVVSIRMIQLFTGAIEITEGQVRRAGEIIKGKKKIGEAIYSLLPPLQVIILVCCLLVFRILLGIFGLKIPSIMNEAIVGYFSRLSCDELGSGPDQTIDITCSTSENGNGHVQYGIPEGNEIVDFFTENTRVL